MRITEMITNESLHHFDARKSLHILTDSQTNTSDFFRQNLDSHSQLGFVRYASGHKSVRLSLFCHDQVSPVSPYRYEYEYCTVQYSTAPGVTSRDLGLG